VGQVLRHISHRNTIPLYDLEECPGKHRSSCFIPIIRCLLATPVHGRLHIHSIDYKRSNVKDRRTMGFRGPWSNAFACYRIRVTALLSYGTDVIRPSTRLLSTYQQPAVTEQSASLGITAGRLVSTGTETEVTGTVMYQLSHVLTVLPSYIQEAQLLLGDRATRKHAKDC